MRRTTIVECRHVEHGLRQPGAKVDVVEGSNDAREVEAWNWSTDAESRGAKIGLLHGLGHVSGDVRQQGGQRHAILPTRLAQRLRHADASQVVSQSSLDRVA